MITGISGQCAAAALWLRLHCGRRGFIIEPFHQQLQHAHLVRRQLEIGVRGYTNFADLQ